MLKQKRKYTEEFKKETAKLVLEQGYSQADVARRLSINDKNISRWVAQFLNQSNVKQKNIASEGDELIALRKENTRLKLEKEILKKAAAFFAKEFNEDMHL